jgi:magnesium chelatase family protein
MHIELSAVTPADLVLPPPGEGSAEVGKRVAAARDRQEERYRAAGVEGTSTNAACPVALLDEVAKLDEAGLALVRNAADRLHLTARGYHRVIKVARTLADLEGEKNVGRTHLAEALSYRAAADRWDQAA